MSWLGHTSSRYERYCHISRRNDEFDGREFKMERLNQELETSSEEDEPSGASSGPPGLPGLAKSGNQSRGVSSGGHRGGRGRGGGGRGGSMPSGASTTTSSEGYTGGRDRQMKERHKSDHKQRGADRKKSHAILCDNYVFFWVHFRYQTDSL